MAHLFLNKKKADFHLWRQKTSKVIFWGKKEERKKESTKTNQIFFLLTLKNDFQQKKLGINFIF